MCSHFQGQQFGGWGGGRGQWTLQEGDWEEFEPVPNNPKHCFSIAGGTISISLGWSMGPAKWKPRTQFGSTFGIEIENWVQWRELTSQQLLGELRDEDPWSPGVQGQLKEQGTYNIIGLGNTKVQKLWALFYIENKTQVLFCCTVNLSYIFNKPDIKKLPKIFDMKLWWHLYSAYESVDCKSQRLCY